MRLNTNSMNKLYDLMMMTVKYQFLRIKFPEEIIQVTLNHLNELLLILENSDPVNNKDIIEVVKENINYVKKVNNSRKY
jgi:hypothetical protein